MNTEQCWYCGKMSASNQSSVEVSLYGHKSMGGNRFVNTVEKIIVPRCQECKDIHAKVRNGIKFWIIACWFIGCCATPLLFATIESYFPQISQDIFFKVYLIIGFINIFVTPFAVMIIVEHKVVSKGIKLHRSWHGYLEVVQKTHLPLGFFGTTSYKASL